MILTWVSLWSHLSLSNNFFFLNHCYKKRKKKKKKKRLQVEIKPADNSRMHLPQASRT